MEEKYWKQFESSGRIEDYLSFVSNVRQEQARESDHAGTYIDNGNYPETDPGGGVRQTYQPFD